MAVVLSDKDFKTVNSALLQAHLELSFVHGLHVTDVPDVEFTFDLDCSETTQLINDAISVLDKFS